MESQGYTISIEIAAKPDDVFDRINEVPKWFKGKGFEGSSTKLNDEFVFRYGGGDDAHYSKQKLVEFIPGKKVVWLITDSKINWIENNKEEWTNTKVVFELSGKGDKTMLQFTHDGLVPALNCYSNTVLGWDIIIKDWLFNYIMANNSFPA